MPIRPEDVFEIAYVVPDVEKALHEFSTAYGYTWAPIADMAVQMRTPEGKSDWPLHYTYSIEAPHIEIVREIPGTLLTATEGNHYHHLGAWSDDLASDAKRLESQGMPMIAWGVGGATEPAAITFHRPPSGALIELIDRSLRPGWLRWINEGIPPEHENQIDDSGKLQHPATEGSSEKERNA